MNRFCRASCGCDEWRWGSNPVWVGEGLRNESSEPPHGGIFLVLPGWKVRALICVYMHIWYRGNYNFILFAALRQSVLMTWMHLRHIYRIPQESRWRKWGSMTPLFSSALWRGGRRRKRRVDLTHILLLHVECRNSCFSDAMFISFLIRIIMENNDN